MQLYRGLPILTNQSPARLVGIWPLDHEASVAEYQELAHAAIDEILAAGRTPVVVGGTGLYLRAALADLALPPAPEPGSASAGRRSTTEEGPSARTTCSPSSTPRPPPPSIRTTGAGSSAAWSPPAASGSANRLWTDETRHPTLVFGLDVPKEELDRRIEARTRAMFEARRPSRGRAGARRPDLVDRAPTRTASPTSPSTPTTRPRSRPSSAARSATPRTSASGCDGFPGLVSLPRIAPGRGGR